VPLAADAIYAFGRSIVTGKRSEKSRFGGVIVARFFMQMDAIAKGLASRKK
jgi:hypothetical protein